MEYKSKWLTKGDFTFIEDLYVTYFSKEKLKEKLRKVPDGFLTIILNRLQKNLDDKLEEKKKKTPEWRKCCELNFTKSLDHLSFIFKTVQKHKTKKSAIEDEIKRIEVHDPTHKSLNELKGGNKDNEFFCTYSNLNMGVSRVYSEDSTKAP